ncbi:MAG: hypothetical protein EXR77_19525 [Myxococcales bacterium]|nr:hypothetical protein [Myxococcales bacterium]
MKMSDKIAQRFEIGDTVETGKLGVLMRAVDERHAAPALILRLAASTQSSDEVLDAIVADNQKLGESTTILMTYAHGRDDQGPWLAIEAASGCTLDEVLKRRDKLETPQLLDIALTMARATADASAAGVWHGEIGPHRLWLNGATVGTGKVRVFGHGWWRLLPGLTTASGPEDFFGAPEYLAAEACKGAPLTSASDIYSAATALWALTAGKPPFQNQQPLTVAKRQAAEKPLRLDLLKPTLKGVKDLQGLLAEALDKDPAKRPAPAAWLSAIEAATQTWGPLAAVADVVVAQRAQLISRGGAAGAGSRSAENRQPTGKTEAAVSEPVAAAAPVAAVAPVATVAAAASSAPVTPAAPAQPAAGDPDATSRLSALPTQIGPAVATKVAGAAPAETARPGAGAGEGNATAADDNDDDDDDADEGDQPSAADSNRRGKKGKKSRRDRAAQALAVGKPTPIGIAKSGAPVGGGIVATTPMAAKAQTEAPVSAAAAPSSVVIGGAAAAPKLATVRSAAETTKPAEVSEFSSNRVVKTTDRIRVEAMHESAFFSHEDKPLPKGLHHAGPPIAPQQKVNKILLVTIAGFAVAMVGIAAYMKITAPPDVPIAVPGEEEVAAPAPAAAVGPGAAAAVGPGAAAAVGPGAAAAVGPGAAAAVGPGAAAAVDPGAAAAVGPGAAAAVGPGAAAAVGPGAAAAVGPGAADGTAAPAPSIDAAGSPAPVPAPAATLEPPAAAVVAPDVETTPGAKAAKLVEEGTALMRSGALELAMLKAKEAQGLNAGSAPAVALQSQIEQAQADAKAAAAASAARADDKAKLADGKAKAEQAELAKKQAEQQAAAQKAQQDAKAAQEAGKQAELARQKADEERAKGLELAAKKSQADAKKAEASAAKEEAARKKQESAAAKKADDERSKHEASAKKADADKLKSSEADKARRVEESRKKKEDAAAKKEAGAAKEAASKKESATKATKTEKAAPPPVAEQSDAQKEAHKFAGLAQKATTAKLKVLYLRKAVDKDPANAKYKQMLKDAEAELAAAPN